MIKLADTMKTYEKQAEYKIPYDNYLIVRVDGHKFSKFTKKFDKPYDYVLSLAMENTTKDLVEKFGATVGYVQSDEITLIFPPVFSEKDEKITNNQIFGGRTQKMASLIASFASIRFNYWLETQYKFNVYSKIEFKGDNDRTEYNNMIKSKLGTAFFDARVFGVPTKEDAFLAVMWRFRDAVKNSKSMFAQAYCSHKSLLNKTGDEQIAFCLSETGNNWHDVEDRFRFGIFYKKEKYMKYADVDGESKMVERTKTVPIFKTSFYFNDDNISFVVNKFS